MRQRTNYHAGLAAEQSVAHQYERAGYEITERRYRSAAGEIDLIARRDHNVIFIEVKKSSTHSRAAESLSRRQMNRIYASASAYLGTQPAGQHTPSRFDVALVDRTGQIEVLENAFAA
ncbi:MAG: YraN family protein [Paracoccaceae bacterium]